MNCGRSGCSGTIDDGYCDTCGMAPRAVDGAAALTAPPSDATTAIRRATTARTVTTTRARLGAGLVALPPVARRDPVAAVLADPQVPEDKRFCGECDKPVGRGRDGLPGRVEGFCPSCRRPFSFTPKLSPGELVAGQYEVVGCLAHGGLGWIYLAKDRNVADRWVVLKGLLDIGDADAMAAALAERRFLAEVEHPNIVKIHNFVDHDGAGYIVMEYVDGSSLRETLIARKAANDGQPDPLPLDVAIAYILEILPALGHLHSLGLLYCDFKPDNVMSTPNGVKLIDLGGVYRLAEPTAAVYGTVGFKAPEIASTGPTVPSDLYTVGRTLAVLCTEFRGYQSTLQFALPPVGSVAQYLAHPALYRFLERATAPNPDDRFQSAEEMAAQLLGVLHQVVAAETGRQSPVTSTLFSAERANAHNDASWRTLPTLLVSADDPASGYLASLDLDDFDQLVEELQNAPEQTAEVRLRLARTLLDHGEPGAYAVLDALAADDPWEWRVDWYRALIALDTRQPTGAVAAFELVDRVVPGELAVKLALGVALEAAGDTAGAAGYYDVVSRTDPGYTSAAFGLARCRLALGDRAGAVRAYERIPTTSSAFTDASVATLLALLDDAQPDLAAVLAAARIAETIDVDPARRARLSALVLECALPLASTPSQNAPVLGHPFTERDLRLGLESTYRTLARHSTEADERVALVDRANRIRPRTLL
jgi:serine/threonine-protein kinase PknG